MNRIDQLQRFLLAAPHDCFLKHALALEYLKIQDWAKARQSFEENLAFDPDYLATYYHLGQLLEKLDLRDKALAIYQKGMELAKTQKDQHAFNELRSVQEELLF